MGHGWAGWHHAGMKKSPAEAGLHLQIDQAVVGLAEYLILAL